MQQYLPFTVLKLALDLFVKNNRLGVATVLTVYGIETDDLRKAKSLSIKLQQYLPFTVLKL